jgi:tetratricopeptide (TPR) repeat protein
MAKEYPYDMRYLTILGDVYLNNGKEEEAYETYQKVLKEEPGYAPALLSMASYYEKKGQDSLYQVQLDTILLNDNVDSDTKMNIMRQLILRSEQTNKDSTKIAGLFTSILKEKQENADIAMLAAQYLLTKKMDKEATPVLHQVLEIDQDNTNFTTIIGINCARRIQDSDAFLNSQPATWTDLRFKTFRQCDIKSRRNQTTLQGFQHNRFVKISTDIHPCRLPGSILG